MFGLNDYFDISYLKDTKVNFIIEESLKDIKKNDVVLLSVFSTESRSWTTLTTILLKKLFKNTIKIGLGGPGVRNPGETLFECDWGDDILKRKLCDFIFLGEASRTLKEQIKNDFKLTGKLYNQDNIFPELGFLPLNLAKDNTQRIVDPSYKKAYEFALKQSNGDKNLANNILLTLMTTNLGSENEYDLSDLIPVL